MRLDIAVAEWCLDRRGIDSIKRCGELGISGLHYGVTTSEIAKKIRTREWVTRTRQECERWSVKIHCLALNVVERTGILSRNSILSVSRGRDSVQAAIDAALELEIPLVYIPCFGKSQIATEGELEEMSLYIRDCCVKASDTGVTIASENSLNAVDNARLAANIDCANYRLLFDSYNPLRWGHSSHDIVVHNKDWISNQVHIKDGIGADYGTVPLGSGEGNVEQIFQLLLSMRIPEVVVLENNYTRLSARMLAQDISALNRWAGLHGV